MSDEPTPIPALLVEILQAGADAAEFYSACGCGASRGVSCLHSDGTPGASTHPLRPRGDSVLAFALRTMAGAARIAGTGRSTLPVSTPERLSP